jgi:phosphoglycerate dehydrogenase-like enzyme
LVDLASEQEAWSIPPACVDSIRAAFGPEWEVHEVKCSDAVITEASGKLPDDKGEYGGVEAYFGWSVPRKLVSASAGTLKWAHTGAAGVGGSINDELIASGAVVTNSRGVHAEPMADWVIASIGFCIRGFHEAVAAQRAHRWEWEPFHSSGKRMTEYSSVRVGIVGLGGIGMTVARKCRALGMTVRAIRRRPSAPKPPEVEWVGGPRNLSELAEQSDVLVLALPRTASTKNLVDDAILRALPRGAYLLNVARGGILDESALIEHLENGHIRGCVLDVFASEPLDADHPFWDNPRVFMTPHVSAVTDRFWEREIDLIVENIGRYLKGDRLRNVVNLDAGY